MSSNPQQRYNTHIIDKVLQALQPYDDNKLDLYDKIQVIGLNSVVHTTLYGIQQGYPGLVSDLLFDYDPYPFLHISWQENITGLKDDITFRFNPLRVEKSITDAIAAYDRAMAII